MVQGIARDDEEQAGTRGGFGPTLGFTTVPQRISGQRWASPSVIPEMRTLSGAKRRDSIIKPIAGWRWHGPRAEGIQIDNGRLLDEQRPFARSCGVVTRYDEQGWRATFDTSGMEHSATSATGTAWERAPWRAVRQAAWQALNQDSPRAASEGKPG